MAANAIHRSTLHEQTERRVAQLDALRSIEQTINSSMDMRVTFNVILQQAISLLQADALAVLLYNSRTLQLDHAASTGFRSGRIRETSMRIGEGHAGKAALERHFIGVDDIRGDTKVKNGISFLEDEGFLSYHAIPLIVKAEIKGVLEVFHRAPYTPDEEWMANLRALATQTAIAIDNHEMFDGLQRAASNLSLAVDETLESWGKALALRSGGQGQDTRRLTDMTLRLARAAGVNDADSVHLVRGALLHDIGEMAVPEALLNKTGALTDEEWEVVRAHPQVAYDLIYPIRHLRPALDIPYCHHERWDGSGYPRGLKGEAIPLAARVFAVVDVYDALISKRPYRPAWKKAKAQAYIREGSGSQFDPRMVELFFKILKDFEKE
jgi:HD-GYP domain-containing protein (c-di-GMP phosphodiesterase class II)